MENTAKAKKINKTVAIFIFAVPIVGLLGLAGLIYSHMLNWNTVIFSAIYAFIGALTITAGYHRLFSHVTYKAKPIIRFLFALIGASQFEGSVIEWSTDHRNHHRFSETEKDPYSITEGFWHAHMGWLIYLDSSKRDYSNVKDLTADKMLMFMHRHFVSIAIVMGFIFPMVFCGLCWGDWIGGLLIGGALRIALNQQSTFCINSICHKFGSQKYSKEQTARDNWVTALITTGEGYHNYHHQFPLDYRNGIKFYHYDPAKWLIKGLALCGLASDLRTQSKHKIIQYKVSFQEKNWFEQWSDRAALVPAQLEEIITPLKNNLMAHLKYIDDCERQIKKIRQSISQITKEKVDQWNEVMAKKQQELADYQQQIKNAHHEVRKQLKTWKAFLKQHPTLLPK
jgi:stearoyl-CoA desaturase (delta-9 desaturase)